MRVRSSMVSLIALVLVFPAWSPAQDDTRSRIVTNVELVLVPVTVKDARGNVVGDLRRGDFRILEDGMEQPIAQFTVDPFPLSAVVLLDGDMPDRTADTVEKSLAAIAAGFGPSDEVALVQFDEYPETLLEFTSDNDKLFTQLKRHDLPGMQEGQGSGVMTSDPKIMGVPITPDVPVAAPRQSNPTKRLDDAIHAAGLMLRGRGRDRRKILFIISDGRNGKGNQFNFDQNVELLLSNDVSVYAVDASNVFTAQLKNPLAKYAAATGGDLFQGAKQSQLERIYSTLTEEARNQYTLAFVPHPGPTKSDFHSIEVRVKRPDLVVLARQGYYASGVRR